VYSTPDKLVDDSFAKHASQRELYDEICAAVIDGQQLRVQPCKGSVPVYSARNVVVASFKPTADGLCIGLLGDGFSFTTIPHRSSRGGAER
jgi:hypothetical protein